MTETEGGMGVICKTIDQPVDERCRQSSDMPSHEGEVPFKIVRISMEQLLAWMENTMYPPYLLWLL